MSDSIRRFRILTAFVLALAIVAVTLPAKAHEGRSLEASAVVARVDGRLRVVGPLSDHVAVALRSDQGLELGLVDLGKAETPATPIDFQLSSTRELRLEVLDLEGNLVRTLARGVWAQGRHQLAWHHDSESGESLDRGLNVVRRVDDSRAAHLAAAR